MWLEIVAEPLGIYNCYLVPIVKHLAGKDRASEPATTSYENFHMCILGFMHILRVALAKVIEIAIHPLDDRINAVRKSDLWFPTKFVSDF